MKSLIGAVVKQAVEQEVPRVSAQLLRQSWIVAGDTARERVFTQAVFNRKLCGSSIALAGGYL
jgi:hypothetical protein